MRKDRTQLLVWSTIAYGLAIVAAAQEAHKDLSDARRGCFQTPVSASDFDPAAFAELVDGQPLVGADAAKVMPELIWTHESRQRGAYGYMFGKSRKLGVRHLRLGFTRVLPMGAIVAAGNVRVSVLKAESPYPGDPADESQWIAAQRVGEGRVTGEETTDPDCCTLWTLPPGTQSRALRFTHTALVAADVTRDGLYAGTLGGVYILPGRLANLAPLAIPSSRSGNENAGRIINGRRDNYWKGWENINRDNPDALAAAKPVSENPEWLMLTWPEPVDLQGVAFLVPFFASADVQRYTGKVDTHPRDAGDAAWTTVASVSGLRSLYPLGLPLS